MPCATFCKQARNREASEKITAEASRREAEAQRKLAVMQQMIEAAEHAREEAIRQVCVCVCACVRACVPMACRIHFMRELTYFVCRRKKQPSRSGPNKRLPSRRHDSSGRRRRRRRPMLESNSKHFERRSQSGTKRKSNQRKIGPRLQIKWPLCKPNSTLQSAKRNMVRYRFGAARLRVQSVLTAEMIIAIDLH
jgi:hypothetical protein